MLADLRHALRGLLRQPAFALTVVATLGLGIGANTAVFSAVHALLLRPFPFTEPDRLIRISSVRGGQEGPLSIPEQDDLAGLTDVIADIALYTDQGMYNASGFGEPEELQATITTHNLFRVLGIDPVLGSTYPAETDRTRRFELVISHGLWTRRFGQDPQVIGRTMTLDGAPGYVIHGVLPPGFNFPSHSDLFRSSGISPDPRQYERRDLRQRMAVARLQPGITVGEARARIEALGTRLAREFPETNDGLQFHVQSIRELYVGQVRPYLLLLFAAVGLVLLIACANVVNLLLSRAIARDRDVAVRIALGASRAQVIRQALAESLVLALAGGAAGLGLAWIGIDIITTMVRADLPPWMTITLDGTTLAFLAAVSVATGLGAGLVLALRSGDGALHGALKDGARGSSGGVRHQRLRSVLVVAEVALAVMLLVGAALMVQSFLRLQGQDPGFRTDQLLTFRVELGWRAYGSHESVVQFNDTVVRQIAALPGVEAVAVDSNLPLSGRPRDPYEIGVEGQAPDAARENPYVNVHVVSANYFDVMGIPIEQGRGFTELDGPGGQQVAVVSRRLADRLWPGEDPTGRVLRFFGGTVDEGRWIVAGVAGDIRHAQLDATDVDVYRPYRQSWTGGSYFLVRTAPGVDPMSLARAATRLVPETDPNQSYFDVRTMEDRIRAGMWQQQVAGVLFGGFAVLALVLAAIGLYGVLSYLVTQQWREIGVRIALGAEPRDVVRLVVGRGLALTGVGLALGLAGAAAGARALGPMLYETRADDVRTFVFVPLLLAVVAVAACAIPAHRATRVDPVVALRTE